MKIPKRIEDKILDKIVFFDRAIDLATSRKDKECLRIYHAQKVVLENLITDLERMP